MPRIVMSRIVSIPKYSREKMAHFLLLSHCEPHTLHSSYPQVIQRLVCQVLKCIENME